MRRGRRGGGPGEAAGHRQAPQEPLSLELEKNVKRKTKTKPHQGKWAKAVFFFFAIFIIQSRLFLKMDSRWHLEQSCVQLRKANQKESQNSGISRSWATGFGYVQTRRTAGPALASEPPTPTQPSHTASGQRWHCSTTAHLLFPPPQTPFLAFSLFQMGVNSSWPFKTLLGGGDAQAPSGTPTFPVTLLDPDPAHTPAGDSCPGLSPP